MHVLVVGAGPTGSLAALALARRGHHVTVVDRDPGPGFDGRWDRRGVMQFHHAHGYRAQVIDVLRAEAPDVLDALLRRGAVVSDFALLCRRSVFDRALWTALTAEPRVRLRTGHVDRLEEIGGRVRGVVADGLSLDADLVVDASGRAGRALAGARDPAEGMECGVVYVGREYALRPGAEPGPVNSPIGMSVGYPHYMAIVFQHDGPTFSVLIACASTDRPLRALRRPEVFAAAERAIPHVAEWTDPVRAEPIGPVRSGAGMRNAYQGQLRAGRAVPGLVALGDAVCTTTPLAGRGVALSFLQIREFLRLMDRHDADTEAVALALHDWCDREIRPWFSDHVHGDADRVRRWSGGDVDVSRRLPSELIVAAAEADPELRAVTGPYEGMLALPSTLETVEPRAREIYADGWRPTLVPGPTRDELAELTLPHLTVRVPSMPKW